MSDNYTEVTTQGWGSRLKNSIGGVVGGLVLFVLSFVVLFWNEGNSVKTIRALDEVAAATVSVSVDDVRASNDGKLVHVTGTAITEDILSDSMFKVSENAMMLSRDVEMYQWKENVSTKEEKEVGGKTKTTKTYSYSKEWSSSEIDSESFKKPDGHKNPKMVIEAMTSYASSAKFGGYELSGEQIAMISGADSYEYKPEQLEKTANVIKSRSSLHNGGVYMGEDPSSPEVGDYRISFKIINPSREISVIGQQQGNRLSSYSAKSGKSIFLLDSGIKSKDEMITAAKDANAMMTWILRLVGFLMMFGGLNLLFRPLSVLGDVVPIIGSIIGMGFTIVSFLISVSLSALTIAIAWIFFRPLVGVLLLVVTIGAIAGLFYLKKKKTAAVN
ncbi:MAG: TMEM43 family protein [Spirochaetes bacterium]|nr:TMEM43 family protein [Spirochaetota bacterium]MBN2769387.1 TMEM43 family protein [Spirochaetota bacterium]